MDEYFYILFYLHTKEEFYNPDKIQYILDLLLKQGSHIYESDSERSDYENHLEVLYKRFKGSEQERARLMSASISAGLQREIPAFIQQQKDELSISAYHLRPEGFDITVSFYPSNGYFQLSILGEDYLNANDEGFENYRTLLEMVRQLYRLWRPLFVYKYSWEKGAENIGWDEIRALDVPQVYDLNLYGPELVAKLGREKLLTAPAWLVEEVDDGILLIPEEHISMEAQHSLQEVAAHLGLQAHFRPDEYDF